jgi:hypothetical protein
MLAAAKYGCILWIAVHPAFRRRGIVLTLTTVVVDALKKEGTKAVFALPKVEMQHAKGTLGKAQFKQVTFLGLWRVFGWRIFSFYREIWYAPGEIVFMQTILVRRRILKINWSREEDLNLRQLGICGLDRLERSPPWVDLYSFSAYQAR